MRTMLLELDRPKGHFTTVQPASTLVSPYIPPLKGVGLTGFFYK